MALPIFGNSDADLVTTNRVESLILGNKGAAGLVWGSMSIFGALSIIRGCVAAATADDVRESVGLRTKETDGAVGLSLDLNVKSLKNRSRIGGAAGIICKVALIRVSPGYLLRRFEDTDLS